MIEDIYRKMIQERNVKIYRRFELSEEIKLVANGIPEIISDLKLNIVEQVGKMKTLNATDTEIYESVYKSFISLGLMKSVAKSITKQILK